MAALLLWDRGSHRLPKVGRCTQGDGASQGWALHRAAAPLGAVVHAEGGGSRQRGSCCGLATGQGCCATGSQQLQDA